MKVAFTSSNGICVDCHFGSSEAFFVWEVGLDKARCLGQRCIPDGDGQEDRIIARANLLLDCAILCTAQIGDPPPPSWSPGTFIQSRPLPPRPWPNSCSACRTYCADIPRPGYARPWAWRPLNPIPRSTNPHEGKESFMAYLTGITRGKQEWTPRFVKAVDDNKCIGCGRCMKICAHEVLAPKEVDEEESAKMFASVKNPDNCIGCEACGRTCSKKAFSFEPLLM